MIFETARLTLRPLTADDAQFMVRMWTDPQVYRFIGGAKTPDETRHKIQEAISHQNLHGYARWAVTLKTTGELIGLCGPMNKRLDAVEEIELGYAFPQIHWGFGYATEAARASVVQCLQGLGFTRVVAIVHPGNLPSIRVIVKIGMHFERSLKWDTGPANLYVIETLER